VKALAVTSRQRSPLAPDVPTVAEARIAALEVEVLYLAMVRANTPDRVTTVLQKAMKDALALSDVQERFTRLDLVLLGETGPGVAELLARTRTRYATTIKAVGMKAD
jgi:tripartite-type tricarboxylate transporter receptor subunit TctC